MGSLGSRICEVDKEVGQKAWMNLCATERVSKGAVWAEFWKSGFEVGFERFSGGDRRRIGWVVSASSGSAKVRIEVCWGKGTGE